jgi:hypothetical protein
VASLPFSDSSPGAAMVNQVGGGRGNQIWAVGAVCAWWSQVGGVGMSEPAGLATSLLARC